MKHILLILTVLFFAFDIQATTHTVSVTNDAFSPSSLTINKGDTVKWSFVSGTHTTTSGTSCTNDGKWD